MQEPRYAYYEVTLTTQAPIRIGGPDDPLSGEHNAIARVGSDIVIPGTTLKGALRAAIESWLIQENYETGHWKNGMSHLKPCIPADKPSVDEYVLINKLRVYRGKNCRYRTPKKEDEANQQDICPVCYILGAMGLEGFVRIPFLYADAAANKLYSCRIDRATKTVAGQTNRPYEFVPKDIEFKGELEILLEDYLLKWTLGKPRKLHERSLGDKWLEIGNPPKQQDIIEKYILNRLESIKKIGGYKSKGFGNVEINVQKLEK